eukprot:NODE_28_length_38599_cov_0.791792.p17 type:complete len:127 gc:universal NODE_28_length_38599_cov_0.791792:13006-13386(+)
MAPFHMEYYQTPAPVQIWVVTNKVVADLKILFGQTFINQNSLSVKPPIHTWLAQPYSYGYYPQSSPDGAPKVPTFIQSVVLDTEFIDADETEKYMSPISRMHLKLPKMQTSTRIFPSINANAILRF